MGLCKVLVMPDLKLAPGWRGEETVPIGAGADGSKESTLDPGEYRTVLAEQRTLLAFVRTALAVTAVYGNTWIGGVVGALVLLVGVLQYALGADLFLNRRTPKGIDTGRLLSRATVDSWMVGIVITAIAAASVLYKATETSNDVDGTNFALAHLL